MSSEFPFLHAAAMRDLRPADVQTLVVLGSATDAWIAAASTALPGLRRVLTVAAGTPTDPGTPRPVARCIVTSLRIEHHASAASVYLGLSRHLWSEQAVLASTVVMQAPSPEEVSPTWVAGVEDCLVHHGRNFAHAIQREGERLATHAFVRAWGDALLAQGQPLHALRMYDALTRMTQAVDPALAVRLMKAWCALEQPGQALEWLPQCRLPDPQSGATVSELTAVMREQADAQRSCWQANEAHFRVHFPELHAAVMRTPVASASLCWLLEEPWRLHMSHPDRPVLRQEYPLLVREGPGGLEDVNTPRAPVALYDSLSRSVDVMQTHVVIGDLVRFDALLNVLANPVVSRVPHRRQIVYGLIPDLAMFRRFAEVQDLRALLTPQRLELLWGEDAPRQLVQSFREHRGRPIPEILTGAAENLKDALDSVLRERVLDFQRAAEVVSRLDAPGAPGRVLDKLQRGQGLRIWTWSSKHTTVLQYVAQDLKAAFESLGHTFEVLIEADERELVDKLALNRSLAAFEPDVLFFLDHFRPQFADLLPRHHPTIAWFLDEIPQMRDPTNIARLAPQDLTFTWNEGLAEVLEALGYHHAESLPFAANPELYASRASDDGALPEDSVAFITHLAAPGDQAYAPGFVAAMAAKFRQYDVLPSGASELMPVVQAVIEDLDLRLDAVQRETLMCIANAVGRHTDRTRVAESLIAAGLPVACYGRGWSEDPRFAAYARGIIRPGEDLRCVYRRHKVVLHINTRCNLHPRVLETMLSGGFVMARSDGDFDHGVGGTAQHFDLERELCLFRDNADLVQKVRRAFEDEAWRQAFIAAGRARVLASHTYQQRAQTMLDRLREVLSSMSARRSAVGGSVPAGWP